MLWDFSIRKGSAQVAAVIPNLGSLKFSHQAGRAPI